LKRRTGGRFAVAKYFPLAAVIAGCSTCTRTLLGVRFREAPAAPALARDVGR